MAAMLRKSKTSFAQLRIKKHRQMNYFSNIAIYCSMNFKLVLYQLEKKVLTLIFEIFYFGFASVECLKNCSCWTVKKDEKTARNTEFSNCSLLKSSKSSWKFGTWNLVNTKLNFSFFKNLKVHCKLVSTSLYFLSWTERRVSVPWFTKIGLNRYSRIQSQDFLLHSF